MNNKLFLTCPFSQLEEFLGGRFSNACFMTAIGGRFPFHDRQWVHSVAAFIAREQVSEVLIVCDRDSMFLPVGHNEMMQDEMASAPGDNLQTAPRSMSAQREDLAAQLVRDQLTLLLKSGLMTAGGRRFRIRGLVCNKQTGTMREISFD